MGDVEKAKAGTYGETVAGSSRVSGVPSGAGSRVILPYKARWFLGSYMYISEFHITLSLASCVQFSSFAPVLP